MKVNCSNYPPVLKACGLYFSQAIIWDKQHPVLTRKALCAPLPHRPLSRTLTVGKMADSADLSQPLNGR